jgi:hypothetical protein
MNSVDRELAWPGRASSGCAVIMDGRDKPGHDGQRDWVLFNPRPQRHL